MSWAPVACKIDNVPKQYLFVGGRGHPALRPSFLDPNDISGKLFPGSAKVYRLWQLEYRIVGVDEVGSGKKEGAARVST